MQSIFIVDDSELMRVFLGNLCEKHGEVSLFSTGESLLTELNFNNIPDIIILDLNLPGVDGMQILQILNQNYSRHIKTYVVSGIDNSEKRIACLALGAIDFVVKPFHPKELEYKISKALN